MIEAKGVYHSYDGENYVLKGVNLGVKRGELVCIMGPNGAGKTTLVRIMGGLIRPTKGRVLLDGLDISQIPRRELARKVGIIFQNPDHQIFSESVEKEIFFSLRTVGIKDVEERINRALQELGIEKVRRRNPITLSGGEKKLVSLAVVIAINPEVVIMDEPTAGQDWHNKKTISEVVKNMVLEGKSVIIVTHDIEFCAELDARVVILHEGRILVDGDAKHVLSNFKLLDKARLKPPMVTQLLSMLWDKDENGPFPVKLDDAVAFILERCKVC
ncbi:MAG: ABC transporter ATP-binding protein [Candidatus Jordarchaeales archaeon]